MGKRALKIAVLIIYLFITAVASTFVLKRNSYDKLFNFKNTVIVVSETNNINDLKKGDLVVFDKITENKEFVEGEIVLLLQSEEGKETKSFISKFKNESYITINGEEIKTYSFIDDQGNTKKVYYDHLVGSYKQRVPILGYFIAFATNQIVFLIVVTMPLIVLTILYIHKYILISVREETAKEG